MCASIASLTDAVRARENEEFRQAAKRRNQMLAQLSTRDREAHRARLEKSWKREPSSMPRVMAEIRRGLPDDVVIAAENAAAALRTNAGYAGIVDAFASGAPTDVIESAIWASPWASGHYADGGHWAYTPVPVVKSPDGTWGQ